MVKDGDRIIIDSEQRTIDWLVDESEQVRRKNEWGTSDKGQLKEKKGVLFRYARDVAVSPPLVSVWIDNEAFHCSPPVLAHIPTEKCLQCDE